MEPSDEPMPTGKRKAKKSAVTPARPAEEGAFRELYRRHAGDVVHFLRLFVRDEQDRLDVASATFETAAREFHGFEVPEGKERRTAERNWLFAIARNKARAFRRKHPDTEQLDESVITTPRTAENEVAAAEVAYALLWTLAERDRTIYVLSNREGYTDAEVAELLSIPLGTVKTSLRRSQKHLDAAVDRLCAREHTTRDRYLGGAMVMPGLLLRLEEELDPEVADYVWHGVRRGGWATTGPAVRSLSQPPPWAPGSAVGRGAWQAGDSAASTARPVVGAKLAALAVVSAIGGGVGSLLLWPRPPAAPHTVAAEASPLPAAAPTPEPTQLPAAATPNLPTVRAPAARRESAPAETYQTEADAIQAARNAFGTGDFGRALRAADRHLKQYPGGSFAPEREAIAIRALAHLGRLAEARARARTFRRAFPNSLFRGAVDAATGESGP